MNALGQAFRNRRSAQATLAVAADAGPSVGDSLVAGAELACQDHLLFVNRPVGSNLDQSPVADHEQQAVLLDGYPAVLIGNPGSVLFVMVIPDIDDLRVDATHFLNLPNQALRLGEAAMGDRHDSERQSGQNMSEPAKIPFTKLPGHLFLGRRETGAI